ncbi:MAG TPA: isochorismatase family cysteine hydrolase [Solirubrobacteraceae bacterium]|jgi:nicotinamidase-related amidase
MTSALIVTDMLNRYDHADAEPLMQSVGEMLPNLCALIGQAREHDVLTVYVNDNHGDWTAGRRELADAALGGRDPSLVQPILPPEDAPFVVKARHSVFYGTQLEYMLRQFEIERLILAGQVTEQCILYSALDAYVRHFEVVVPRDAVAHIHPDLAEAALRMMDTNMRAEVVPSAEAVAVSSQPS